MSLAPWVALVAALALPYSQKVALQRWRRGATNYYCLESGLLRIKRNIRRMSLGSQPLIRSFDERKNAGAKKLEGCPSCGIVQLVQLLCLFFHIQHLAATIGSDSLHLILHLWLL